MLLRIVRIVTVDQIFKSKRVIVKTLKIQAKDKVALHPFAFQDVLFVAILPPKTIPGVLVLSSLDVEFEETVITAS
jgi:hypothetical protein